MFFMSNPLSTYTQVVYPSTLNPRILVTPMRYFINMVQILVKFQDSRILVLFAGF
jgi:hypothetical protein